jgi:hypothetical protein
MTANERRTPYRSKARCGVLKANVALVSVLLALGTGACATRPPPQGFVAEQWGRNLAELRILPVFPPREDVQPGDVYFAALNTDPNHATVRTGAQRPLIWFDYIDLTGTADRMYQRRPSLPRFGENLPQRGSGDGVALPQPASSTPLFGPAPRANRLRLVQFPGFNFATLTAVDLGVAAPIQGLNLLAGIAADDDTTVSVSVPQAESYGIPLVEVWPVLMARCRAHQDLYGRRGGDLLTGMFTSVSGTTPTLLVMTEVFYARAMDFDFRRRGGFGADIAATLPDLGALSEGLKALAAAARQSDGALSSQENIAGRAEALAARAEIGASRATSLPAPGVRASVVAVGERGVRLRATFDRPVAIGYRGIALQPAAGGPCEFAPVQVPVGSLGVMPAPPPPNVSQRGS